MQKTTSFDNFSVGGLEISRGKAFGFIFLVGLFIYLPLLTGHYGIVDSEQNIFVSFIGVFTDMLKRFELPLWNEYVANGLPAVYFGQYPLNLTALFYSVAGYSSFSYALLHLLFFLGLALVFDYLARAFDFPRLLGLIAALIYFSISWYMSWTELDNSSHMQFIFPMVFFLLIKNMETNFTVRSYLIAYYLSFVVWISGGHVTYMAMHGTVLGLMYLIGVFVVYRLPLARSFLYFLLLLVVPWLTVSGQLYIVADVIADSSRIREGLVVPLSAVEPILQMLRSIAGSSYLWVAAALVGISGLVRARKINSSGKFAWGAFLIFLVALAVGLRLAGVEVHEFSDYNDLLGSPTFWLGGGLFAIHSHRIYGPNFWKRLLSWEFFFLISALSYYLFLPGNVPWRWHNDSYERDIFLELPLLTRALIVYLVLLCFYDEKNVKARRLLLLTVVALYFLRSHVCILFLRYLGIPWYAARDGLVHCCFFAYFTMAGAYVLSQHFKTVLGTLSARLPKLTQHAILALIILFTVSASYRMYYSRFISQRIRSLSKDTLGKNRWEAFQKIQNQFGEIRKTDPTFYRVWSPLVHDTYMPGALQHLGHYEAGEYDSTIAKGLVHLVNKVIMQSPPEPQTFQNSLPYHQYAKHVHIGLQVPTEEIPYRWVFLFPWPNVSTLKMDNLRLWLNLTQTKYIIASTPEQDFFSDSRYFEKVGDYSAYLGLNAYIYKRPAPATRWAYLELKPGETVDSIVQASNVDEASALSQLYDRLTPLDSANYRPYPNHEPNDQATVEYNLPGHGILFNFEAWNKHWQVKVGDLSQPLFRVFHHFRGIEVQTGKNQINLRYELPLARQLMLFGLIVFVLNLFLLWFLPRKPLSSRF